VANGTYQVTLKFAEIWFTEPGRRVFDIAINGTRVLGHFDPLAQAGGPNRAVDRRFPVVVNNGRLSIEFLPVVSNPKISAIEIVPASGLP
ncbi:MAG TPA: malectin domain-containing carbohydrate-binding protein, partial [Bryobacteraceae bacterium]|nr:malectin domain-containing carbohydrate-binding protein [Bryobacteraceae bacterium]